MAIIIELLHNLIKQLDISIFISISLEEIAQQNEIVQTPELHNFHCTLRDHCSAISEWNWTKFMRFWKIFLCFFEWDRPKIFSPNSVKDMSFQSWMVKTPKSPTTTTTVIWHFSTKIPIHFWFFGYNHWVATYFDQKNWYFDFFLHFLGRNSSTKWDCSKTWKTQFSLYFERSL